jgi:hypothetical protein
MISRLISSGWYHHVWCILTPTMWSMVLCILPRSVVLPFSNIYHWAVNGMGCESVTVTLVRALLVRLWVLVLLLTNMYRQLVLSWCTFELCYWPARSFSRVPCRHASLLVSGFFYMVGLRLCDALSRCYHFWADVPRCYRPIPLSSGRTNSYNIFAITPCVGIWSFRQEAWKPCL